MNPIDNEKGGSAAPQIDQLNAKLLPDRQRVRVTLVLNNAESRPTVELILLDKQQVEIAHSTIIGIFDRMISFTLHPGRHSTDEMLSLQANIILKDSELVNTKKVPVEIDRQ